MGLDIVYEQLGTTITDENEENYKVNEDDGISVDDADNFQIVFANIAKVYKDVENRTEGQEIIEVVNFEGVGATLDAMSQCELFKKAGKGLLSALLSHEKVVDIIPAATTEKLINAWGVTDTKDENYVNYASTFKGIGDMVEAAKTLASAESPKEAITAALTAITSEDVNGDIIKGVLSSDNLQNAGLDKEIADAVGEVVNTITDALSQKTLTGTTAPDDADGNTGDFYINTSNNYIYKKGIDAWEQINSGETTISGPEEPTSEQGSSNNYYIQDTNYKIYKKVDENWVLQNIDKTKEIDGIAAALDIITQTQTETGESIAITEQEVTQIIDAISESTIILDLINSSEAVSGAVDKGKLDDATKGYLESAIENSSLDDNQQNKLKAMLGIS